jgi:hypothetical protein
MQELQGRDVMEERAGVGRVARENVEKVAI